MKKMPKSFEDQLRRYNKLNNKLAEIHNKISNHLDDVGVPYENLVAMVGVRDKEPSTESLAYINNAECKTLESLNDEIESIREVYEYFINK